MSSLLDLVDRFQAGTLLSNPRPRSPDAEARVQQFILEVQASGEDLGKWDEDAWILALRKLGLDDDEITSALEDVAAWGVVDNYVWE